MYKSFLIAFLSFVCALNSFAQFKAAPIGIVTEDDKYYLVKEYEGKTAQQLYKAVEAYIMSSYVSPKNVMSGQEYSMINLSPLYKNAFSNRSVLGVKVYVDVRMTWVFRFKDGRLRIDAPVINSMIDTGSYDECDYAKELFKKNGEPKSENRLKKVNEWLNSEASTMLNRIDEILKSGTVSESNDDW